MYSAPIDTGAVRLGIGSIIAIILIGIGLLSTLSATYWKPGILFGVSVAPDANVTPEGRAIISSWQRFILGSSILLTIAALAAVYWLPYQFIPVVALATPIVLITSYIIGIYYYHNQASGLAIPMSGTVRAASLKASAVPHVPVWWELLPLGVIVATMAYLVTQYDVAPTQIPTHFGFDGTPNAYAAKSIASYFMIVFLQLGLWLVFSLIGLTIVLVRTTDLNAAVSFPALVTRFLFTIKVAVLLLLGSMQALIASNSIALFPYIMVVPLIFLVGIFIGVFFFIRHYSQIAQDRPATGDATADNYWWNGLVYHNRNDPALFVERRVGVGYTLNFGHPSASGILIIFIVLVIAIPTAAIILTAK